MNSIERYNAIFENLQERVNKGEITLEDAQKVNDMAYDRYMSEAAKDNNVEMIEKLAELVKDGKVTLKDEDVKCIKELVDGAKAGEDDEEEAPAEEAK
jgi:hypothetical protein